jgi:hypothetical protein
MSLVRYINDIRSKRKILTVVVAVVTIGLIAGWILANKKTLSTSASEVKIDTAKLKICENAPQDQKYKCYETYFVDTENNYGATTAQKELADLIKTDSYIQSQCHPIAHTLGRTAYKKYGSVPNATKYATEVCWSGYYHGIMEAYMAKFDDNKLLTAMPNICTQTPGKPYSFDYYNCVHGLGHGVTIRFDNDVFKALPYCTAIGNDKSWEQQSCYSGVFMQNIVVDGVAHTSKNLKTDDPIYPCDAVSYNEKNPCYLIVTSHVLQANGYNYQAGFAACNKVEEPFNHTCYQSMGRDISGNFLLDTSQIIARCAIGAAELIPDCYIGAVKNDVFNDRNTVKANDLCTKAPTEYQGTCRSARDEAASTI